MGHIVNFIAHNKNKKMTVRVWYLSAWYRFRIKFFSQKHLEKKWGVLGEESSWDPQPEHERYLKWVAYQVRVSCEKTPWESKCLVQALTARKLLMRKKISCTLYLGVGKKDEEMIAHAWLRSGPDYITGGDGTGYAMVAKFRT